MRTKTIPARIEYAVSGKYPFTNSLTGGIAENRILHAKSTEISIRKHGFFTINRIFL